MVGSTCIDLEQGKCLVPEGVLKLYGVKGSGDITRLVTGTLESLSLEDNPSFFDPITLLMLHKQDYKYNEVSKTIDGDCHDQHIAQFTPQQTSLFNIFSFAFISIEVCKNQDFFSPVSLSLVECSKDGQNLRFLLEFPDGGFTNYDFAFNPSTTLVAEGSWNAKKNQLCVVACRIFSAVGSLNGSYIGDCSIRLSFRFPALWSIRNTRYIEGQIRSNKKTNGIGHFNKIVFGSNQNEFTKIPGLRYTYTMVEKARATCLKDKPSRNKEKQFPEGNSQGMQFQMSFKNSKGREMGWGKARPISVGDQFHPGSGNGYVMNPPSSQPAKIYHNKYKHVEITAEGIYNAETEPMCLIGCKHLDLNNPTVTDGSMNCEILINLQFPTIESRDYIKGYIESQRRKTEPFVLLISFFLCNFFVQSPSK
ncbi:hypothetical protein K2173_016939 [Erythroxylum novogranatense]|uniref:DUF2921 domain-containing protein n=1 Tax=Erythroxylum novogranatense TaxID=1862640 RepID=A0AAV8U5G6_9ROSI|nr:hypothetical protein K2173_016939 [Erythroxylum novogranatense]